MFEHNTLLARSRHAREMAVGGIDGSLVVEADWLVEYRTSRDATVDEARQRHMVVHAAKNIPNSQPNHQRRFASLAFAQQMFNIGWRFCSNTETRRRLGTNTQHW